MRKFFLSFIVLSMALVSCKEEIDTSARYVFVDHTVASYLESQPCYSEYLEMTKVVPMSPRSKSTVYQLLTARGNYTCFAPTNDAIKTYFGQLVEEGLITEPTWEGFPSEHKADSIRQVIVKNSIIDGGDLESQRYTLAMLPTEQNSELPLPNINDHKLTITWPNNKPDSLYINGECAIDGKNRDIPLINGVIHQVHKVIAPKDINCTVYIQEILDKREEGLLVFFKCLQACDLIKELSLIRDEVYEMKYQNGEIEDFEDYMSKGFSDKSGNSNSDAISPEHRKYGFTLFAEKDDFWRSQGIDPLASDVPEKVTQWIIDNQKYLTEETFLTDDNFSSENHILYQWATYHILPMRIPANKLVYHCNEVGYSITTPTRYSIPVFEWYPTMGKRRLLKLFESKESEGVYLNRFPNLDNGIYGTGHELSCDVDKVGCLVMKEDELANVTDIENACIYPIDAPLAYDNATRDNLGKERIRFDGMALFPEAITNGIRRADSQEDKYQHVYIPANKVYQYFDNMSILSDETNFIYFNGYRINWANYTQDEMKAIGRFDIMFTLPPVPKRGTYELRYKTLATGARGIVQIYFGNDPDRLHAAGIPIDMTKGIVDSFGESATWADLDDSGRDEDGIIDVDHKLRNHGLMKAARHEVHESNVSLTARDDSRQTRHILVRETLDPNETYYVRFKSVLDSEKKELYMDYMEWCPKEIYDNPMTPEDVW